MFSRCLASKILSMAEAFSSNRFLSLKMAAGERKLLYANEMTLEQNRSAACC